MSGSTSPQSHAAVIGAGIAAAARAAAGRHFAVGICVVWMRGQKVVTCQSHRRLDCEVSAWRPPGVHTAVVLAVAPLRVAEPVISRVRVFAENLTATGIDVHAVHTSLLRVGAVWTSLSNPAVGGVIGSVKQTSWPPRRHRWLPKFGACTGDRLLLTAAVPLAAGTYRQ